MDLIYFWLRPQSKLWLKFSCRLDLICFGCELWPKFDAGWTLFIFGYDPNPNCDWNLVAGWTLFVLVVNCDQNLMQDGPCLFLVTTLIQIVTKIQLQARPYLFSLWPLFELQPKFNHKLELCFGLKPYPNCDWNSIIGWTLFVLVMTPI
jgi:hypothetical protein